MNNQRGSITLVVLLLITFLIGITAMVVDIGLILVEQQKLSDALDSAALAGAQDLTNSPEQAESKAIEYATLNGVSNPMVIIDDHNKEITVSGQKEVPYHFAKVLGFNSKTISASSKAKVKPLSGGTGFVPIGIVEQEFQYGVHYSLKLGAGDSESGNFGALALGGKGSANYLDNLKYGYDGTLTVGMKIPTEPGNMSGPTKSGIDYRLTADSGNYLCENYQTALRDCNRMLYLPIIADDDLLGRDDVTIVGFAAFYLEAVSGSGNESIIEGRFMEIVFPGDWGDSWDNYYGLSAVKLVN